MELERYVLYGYEKITKKPKKYKGYSSAVVYLPLSWADDYVYVIRTNDTQTTEKEA